MLPLPPALLFLYSSFQMSDILLHPFTIFLSIHKSTNFDVSCKLPSQNSYMFTQVINAYYKRQILAMIFAEHHWSQTSSQKNIFLSLSRLMTKLILDLILMDQKYTVLQETQKSVDAVNWATTKKKLLEEVSRSGSICRGKRLVNISGQDHAELVKREDSQNKYVRWKGEHELASNK